MRLDGPFSCDYCISLDARRTIEVAFFRHPSRFSNIFNTLREATVEARGNWQRLTPYSQPFGFGNIRCLAKVRGMKRLTESLLDVSQPDLRSRHKKKEESL